MRYTDILMKAFEISYQEALPKTCLPDFMPEEAKGKTYVIGAGKAAAEMARVFEEHCPYAFEGLVVTRYGHAVPTSTIKIMEASHPVPDEAGIKATQALLDFVKNTQEEDQVICLLSGGGSALLTCPVEGLSFEDIQDLSKQLLSCGASIHEINTLRKHLNQAFGGKLLQACAPAKVITLAISDVSGDDPSTIASGPTVGDPTTLQSCLEIIEKYKLSISDSVMAYLKNPEHETPKPEDKVFQNSAYHLIATPQKSLEKAAEFLQSEGFAPLILSSMIEGDTNQAAEFHISIIKQILQYGDPIQTPCAILSGGETTVTLTGTGSGGPNTQFMLSSAIALNGMENVYGLSCDTDGIDGAQDNAGALIDPTTIKRAIESGINPKKMLAENNSEAFFSTLDDLITPGPTYTNVNDFRVFLISSPPCE